MLGVLKKEYERTLKRTEEGWVVHGEKRKEFTKYRIFIPPRVLPRVRWREN